MFEHESSGFARIFSRKTKSKWFPVLPYFLEQQTDAQRGAGVFEKSVEAIKRLNAFGYGIEGRV